MGSIHGNRPVCTNGDETDDLCSRDRAPHANNHGRRAKVRRAANRRDRRTTRTELRGMR
jgi:hypothetical protein